MAPSTPGSFPTTHWSLIAEAGDADTKVRRSALEALLRKYLGPLRVHVGCRHRVDAQRADDLLQDFIAGKVLVDQLIPRADRERGRFRTFLLTALDRFVANQFRFDSAQKRAPMAPQCVSLQNLAICEEGPDASKAFDIAWSRQLIRNAIEQMQRECQVNARSDVWDVFEARVLEPMLQGAQPVAYAVLAERSALATPLAAANLLTTGKRMFARVLRAAVGEYEFDESSIDAEIAELKKTLSSG